MPGQFEIGLVNERRGLKRVAAAGELPMSQTLKLIVDQRHQPIDRAAVTAAPCREQLANAFTCHHGRCRRLYRLG